MDAGYFERLLSALVLWPLVAAAVVALWAGLGRAGACVLAAVASGVTLGLALALMAADGTVVTGVPAIIGTLELRADAPARLFALAAAFVWFCAGLYAIGYLRGDAAAGRFCSAALVLLAANLGVFVAGDWISLLVFFEVLGLVGILFVVHAGDAPARRATVKYFWMTFAGGIALLAGIVLLGQATGTTAMVPVPDTPLVRWAIALVLVGFGVKAGAIGLHVWLPDAHSVAPAPGSALLSGVMIKAGAFGVFRSLGVLADADAPATALAHDFGLAVLGFGLAGMLIGAVAAIGQRHAKRLLAWSSVSQMGFILAALGAGAMLGADGSPGLAGEMVGGGAGLMHALNHALFKSMLFLTVGAVVHAAGSGELDRLGGLARRMPLLFAATLVAAAGIVGLPLFNGFVSKTAIHHTLAGLAAAEPGFAAAEWIYFAASIGTAAMFVRLIHAMFLAPPRNPGPVRPLPGSMHVAVWLTAPAIIAVGLWPSILLEPLSLPSGPVELHFGLADRIWPFVLLLAGIAVVATARRFGWLELRLPGWLTVDGAYRRAGSGVLAAFAVAARTALRLREAGSGLLLRTVKCLLRWLGLEWTDSVRIAALGAAMRLPHDTLYRHLDEQRDRIVARALWLANREVRALDEAGRERLLDATRHYAGWLGTRLLNSGIHLEPESGGRLARSRDCCERLARLALAMAVADVRSGHEERALAMADETLENLLGPHRETPAEPMPFRHWLRELKTVLFDLLTDPQRRHWPVSENLAHGAFASYVRSQLRRLAHDPGVGLALAGVMLVVLVLLLFAA